ncbi:hypothetical protein Gxy13693_046_052 [Komagataeibacter xylinus NBRC 13693]|uniref:Uncharacterized protein n=1 Tax=Komagataeibacter xylinus NBRC 13693 TaxID=1234668 RepID=A0A0D6QBS9_KOMXY|nr:hypothetical protein Gxy13693_046_052 [Komagataeibacter xylinus NBRC 13693]
MLHGGSQSDHRPGPGPFQGRAGVKPCLLLVLQHWQVLLHHAPDVLHRPRIPLHLLVEQITTLCRVSFSGGEAARTNGAMVYEEPPSSRVQPGSK